MAEEKQFFRFSWDETGLNKFLNDVDRQMTSHTSRLDKHDDLIAELQRLMREKPSFSDLDRLRDEIKSENERRFRDLDEKLGRVISNVNDIAKKQDQLRDKLEEHEKSLHGLEDRIQQQIADAIRKATEDLKAEIKGVADRTSKSGIEKIGDICQRLKLTEDKIDANSKKIQNTRDHLLTTANAVASFNNSKASLDASLPRVLNSSAQKVKDDLSLLYDSIARIGNDVEKINAQVSAPKPVKPPEPDLMSLSLRPDFNPDWTEPPDLPKLKKFSKVAQAVDYKYDMVPKLQGYLNAIHYRLVDTADLYPDRDEVQKALDDLIKMIDDLNGDVGEIRKSMTRLASKNDISGLLKKLGHNIDLDGNTAVGRVKCIACGRDVPQIAGAMTERDAIRQLGLPSNSVASGRGQMFSSTTALDGMGMIESPRSLRPFKAACSVRRKEKAKRF